MAAVVLAAKCRCFAASRLDDSRRDLTLHRLLLMEDRAQRSAHPSVCQLVLGNAKTWPLNRHQGLKLKKREESRILRCLARNRRGLRLIRGISEN